MSRVYVFNEFGGPDHQQLIERPIPQAGKGEIVIEVKAAGVNPADWKIREGQLGRGWALPAPMGREASGVVIEVGPGVDDFAIGDEVLGFVAPGEGAFADHARMRAAQTVAKPEDVSFAAAATIPVAGTAAYDLTHAIELEPGQTMLVLGAGGGVGLAALEIGRVHKFNVIGVASESKRVLVADAGANFVRAGAGAADAVFELAPEGVDLLIDLVGGQALLDLAPVAKRPELILSAADQQTAEQLGGAGRSYGDDALREITSVVEYGLVNPLIAAEYPLQRAGEALAAVEAGHSIGKTVIIP